MKKLLSLLLVLVLTLSLAFMATACSSSDDDDDDDDDKPSVSQKKDDDDEDEDEVTIEGKWEAELDLADFINEMMEDEMGVELDKKFKNLNVTVVMEFDKDEVELSMEATGIEKAIKKQMPDVLTAVLETMLEEQDLDMTLDELLESQGTSIDELVEESLEDMDFDDLEGSLDEFETSSYELDGDKLYLFDDEKDEDDYVEIKLTSKKLVFESFSADDIPEFMEGLEFKKVK